MPLDVNCPSCRSSFPVVNAGREFHVECPSCDAGIGVSVEPLLGKIGEVPRFSVQLAAAPASARVPATLPRALNIDDDDSKRNASSSAWVVLIGSGIGLFIVLAGLITTGYFLFTNLDTDDAPARATSTTGGGRPMAANPNPQPTTRTSPGPMTSTRTGPPPGFGQPLPRLSNPVAKAAPIVLKPAPTTPFPITPPDLADEVTTVKLPGRAEFMQIGGGGRFLLIAMNPTQARKLLVFDFCRGRVTAELELDRARMTFAAGMNKVVVGYPDRQILRQYRLPELALESELTARLRNGQPITGMALGSSSNGPVFLGGFNDIALFDLEAKTVVAGSEKNISGPPLAFGNEFRASHDGTLFVASSPDAMRSFRVENGAWVEARANLAGPVAVGGRTDVVYGSETLATPTGTRTGVGIGNNPFGWDVQVPAVHGDGHVLFTHRNPNGKSVREVIRIVTPFPTRDAKTPPGWVGVFPELQEVVRAPFMPLDRQLYYVPGAKLLAVVPPTKDKIILRRLKL